MTFVDKNEKVKYFSQGKERIFHRSRAILNRDVKLCHPPSSVHVVEQILEDFKTGKQDHAPFWIQMKGKFIFIEYYALRDESGEYLGTLEVSQDLTEKRALEGEQRILSYKQAAQVGEKPSWLTDEKIVKRLDARPVIEEGGHPLGEVLTGVDDLQPGEIYELVTPFLPAPLIERVVARGFDNWSEKKSEDHFINYFLKK